MVAAADAVATGNRAQAFAGLDPVPSWPCVNLRARDAESAAGFHKVGIADAVHAHEVSHAHAVIGGDIREGLTRLNRDRRSDGRKGQQSCQQ